MSDQVSENLKVAMLECLIRTFVGSFLRSFVRSFVRSSFSLVNEDRTNDVNLMIHAFLQGFQTLSKESVERQSNDLKHMYK